MAFRVGKAVYRGPAVNNTASRCCDRPLKVATVGFETRTGRALILPAALRPSPHPKTARLSRVWVARSESVDVWPLANAILRHNRGHALVGIRFTT